MIYLIGYFNEFCHCLQMKPSVPDVPLKNKIKKQKMAPKLKKTKLHKNIRILLMINKNQFLLKISFSTKTILSKNSSFKFCEKILKKIVRVLKFSPIFHGDF